MEICLLPLHFTQLLLFSTFVIFPTCPRNILRGQVPSALSVRFWLFMFSLSTLFHHEKKRSPKKKNCRCLFLLGSLLWLCCQSRQDRSCQTKPLFNTVTWWTIPGCTLVGLKVLITSFSRYWEGWIAVVPGSRLSMAPLSFKLSFPVLF